MRPHADITIVNRHCTHTRGPGIRTALVELTGRAPVFSTISRAWVCSERTARHLLIPYLENRGYDLTITRPRAAAQIVPEVAPAAAERPDPGAGLW